MTTPSGKPRVALLGCGTVGSAVTAELLSPAWRDRVDLTHILVREPARPRPVPPEAAPLLTTSFDDILDAAPDLVIELLGGLDPATDHIARALARGVRVVTANKTVMARHGPNLLDLARASDAAIACEAAVCAGLPILAALENLRPGGVKRIAAIVSGSCNFILTRLAAGVPMERALDAARARGLVEPDPTADLSARDAAEKACVLAAAAGFPSLTPADVPTEGITSITSDDLAAARRTGHTIKLLAELDFTGDAATARVGPTLVPLSHPLAAVHDEDNAALITTRLAGDLFLKGRGAGPGPTASAVLGDVARLLGLRAAANPAIQPARTPPRPRGSFIRAAAAESITPQRAFAALERHGLAVRELSLARGVAHALVPDANDGAARACATELASGGESLVIPLIGAAAP